MYFLLGGPCEVSLPPSWQEDMRQWFLPKVKHLIIDPGRTGLGFLTDSNWGSLCHPIPVRLSLDGHILLPPRKPWWPTAGPSAVCSILLKKACCLHLSVAWLFNHSLVYLTFQLCTYILHRKIINKVSGIRFIIPALFPLLPPHHLNKTQLRVEETFNKYRLLNAWMNDFFNQI